MTHLHAAFSGIDRVESWLLVGTFVGASVLLIERRELSPTLLAAGLSVFLLAGLYATYRLVTSH